MMPPLALRFLLLSCLVVAGLSAAAPDAPIDRQALVERHNVVLTKVDPDAPLTVGNGGFAFGADITGLQSFAEYYHREGIPVETLSRWAWHKQANPQNYTLKDAGRNYTEADGRTVAYPTNASSPAGDWLRRNPHTQALGQLGLEWTKDDGSAFTPDDIQEPEQTLNLWRGLITSRFKLGGVPVYVITACDPGADRIAVRIESDLLATGKLRVRLGFPRGHDLAVKLTPPLDWSHPEAHQTVIAARAAHRVDLQRTIDGTRYWAAVAWAGSAMFTETAPHQFSLAADKGAKSLAFTLTFAPDNIPAKLPGNVAVLAASAKHWAEFWQHGAAVDFAGSTNPQAGKLEERIILSRYLMAVQMAGDVPPQETGLTCATWYGKHHSEMIWWHTAQFALWGSDALLEKNLAWFGQHLPDARALAHSRGLRGARWAKMVGPDDRESPGGNPLIVWNQPHLIYLCELLYRNHPTKELLTRHRDLVLETADCLASMLHYDKTHERFVLGPPLWIAQEIYDQATSQNPSFELAYWRWTLGVAQLWRERLGLKRDAHWDFILSHLSPLPQKDGLYVALGSTPDTFDNIESRHDHPTMLAPLGVLPGGPDVDRATMGRTLDAVLKTWDWETKIWGWDYPMIAMTATRLGRPETAIEILLRDGPNNRYLPSGHCPQRSDNALPKNAPPGARRREIAVYLPANGAFLSAVALMVGGWDGAPRANPGFPNDGTWKIKAEGFKPLP